MKSRHQPLKDLPGLAPQVTSWKYSDHDPCGVDEGAEEAPGIKVNCVWVWSPGKREILVWYVPNGWRGKLLNSPEATPVEKYCVNVTVMCGESAGPFCGTRITGVSRAGDTVHGKYLNVPLAGSY